MRTRRYGRAGDSRADAEAAILADMTRAEEPTPSEEVVSLPPETFTLASLPDGRLRVVEPIEVVPMLEGGKHVVEAPELNEFGFGDDLSEALSDLQAAIAELYFTLETGREQLGPDLTSVWVVLSKKVRRAGAISCL